MPGHKDWFNKARGELKAAGILICEHDILDIVAFHTHQCVEKALKGYLMFKQKSIPKTHNLEDLLEVCVFLDQSFKMLVHNIMVLDPYAANARYPNDRFSIDHVEAMQAINHATSCFAFVIEKMKT